MMRGPCSSRSPSGRVCDRFDGHDGDHHSADQRAWTSTYQGGPTVDVEVANPAAVFSPAPKEWPDAPPGSFEAQIDSALEAVSLLHVLLATMKRACRAASAPPHPVAG
jgi:hypothetical protein